MNKNSIPIKAQKQRAIFVNLNAVLLPAAFIVCVLGIALYKGGSPYITFNLSVAMVAFLLFGIDPFRGFYNKEIKVKEYKNKVVFFKAVVIFFLLVLPSLFVLFSSEFEEFYNYFSLVVWYSILVILFVSSVFSSYPPIGNLSGFYFLLVQKPFESGDQIKYPHNNSQVEGRIEKICLLHIIIKTKKESTILLSNMEAVKLLKTSKLSSKPAEKINKKVVT